MTSALLAFLTAVEADPDNYRVIYPTYPEPSEASGFAIYDVVAEIRGVLPNEGWAALKTILLCRSLGLEPPPEVAARYQADRERADATADADQDALDAIDAEWDERDWNEVSYEHCEGPGGELL